MTVESRARKYQPRKVPEGQQATSAMIASLEAEGYDTAKLKWTIGDAALPFCYLSTGAITKHWDMRAPKPQCDLA